MTRIIITALAIVMLCGSAWGGDITMKIELPYDGKLIAGIGKLMEPETNCRWEMMQLEIDFDEDADDIAKMPDGWEPMSVTVERAWGLRREPYYERTLWLRRKVCD